MPFFDSKSSAGVELLRNVADSLSHASSKHDLNQIVDIAKPIAERVSLIKPRFEKELKSLVAGKLSLAVSLCSFIGSMLLHLLFFYLYHRFHAVRRLVPKFLCFGDANIEVKPVVTAEMADIFAPNDMFDPKRKSKFLFWALISRSVIKPAFHVLEVQYHRPYHMPLLKKKFSQFQKHYQYSEISSYLFESITDQPTPCVQ